MKLIIILVFVLLWWLSAALTYGLSLNYWQTTYPTQAWASRDEDRRLSLLLGMLGPIGLFVAALNIWAALGFKGFHLRYRPLTREESWTAHQKEYPHLSYDYFLKKEQKP